MDTISLRSSVLMSVASLFSAQALAQVNEFDMWIEPGCPKAGDQVSLYVEYYGGNALMAQPASVARNGDRIRVTYSRATRLFPAPIAGYPSGVSLGTLDAGNYRVEAAFDDTAPTTSILSVDIAVASANTPAQNTHAIWNNPSTPGYGISIFRGDRYLAGTYYTYRNDKTSRWMLLQRAFCTPTGYAGSFIGYNNGNSFESPDSAWTVAPTAVNDGRWVFNFNGANTATLFERGNIFQPNLSNTRNLTRFIIP